MKLTLLNEKQIGKTLATSIYTRGGVIFVKKGATITDRVLERLKSIGVATAYIEDDNDDIVLQEVLDGKIKIEILEKIKKLFDNIKKTKIIDKDEVSAIINKFLEKIDVSENSVYFNNCMDNDEMSDLALHTLEVMIYVVKIAVHREFPASRIETIATSALFHDIGRIFDDPRPHYEVSYDLVKSSNLFGATVFIPIYHQFERIDGDGPLGISGDKVYENSQILHIANDYANLNNAGLMAYEVIEKLSLDALNKFDSQIFKDSINAFYSYPSGIGVVLNDGRYGIVSKQNKGFPSRPVISVMTGSKRESIDLTQKLTIFIEKVDLSA